MILKNYLDFWWRKKGKFSGQDDIRFVTGKYHFNNKDCVRRISYNIVSRTGICWRLSTKHDWKFFGLLIMGNRQTVEGEEE